MSSTSTRQANVLCFGEILWDSLPDGLHPGGAPFNVGYHLQQLGAHVHLVSAIGRDLLGDELIRRLQHWGISSELVCRHHGLPTGTVLATLGIHGDAHYEITSSVAWDQIFATEDVVRAAVGASALVFGSLALRSSFNRNSLERILAVLPPSALRIFDVNLRPPHDDLDLVRELAPRASVLKLNAAEAARLAADAPEQAGSEETHARTLADRFGGIVICVTAGERGAGLLREGRWQWESGRPVEVMDTIGSGDAFVASLTHQLLSGGGSDQEILARACRLGEWVASQRGATPAYTAETPV